MSLTAAQWSQVEALFGDAVDLPQAQRGRQLDRAALDPAVRAELEALLAAADRAGDFLARPATVVSTEPAIDSLAPGTRLGPWRVLRLIGRGGMGEVYEAERADGQFEQRAALKLLWQESAPLLKRFHVERQILARLDHPGIARLLDGGVTPSGQPYAVMEYVVGETLTDWCRARASSLQDRLRLFLQVCEAVNHAHRNLIVHRDLKPANILVDTGGRVRLLDFGIAKLLDPLVAMAAGTLTPAGIPLLSAARRDAIAGRAPTQNAFTPDYAAPEQLAGQAITTGTDIHALGLLLFELLTGRRARSRAGKPAAALALLDRPVPLASKAAAEAKDPPVAPRLLRGDLDAIVSKCLRTEPGQRYPSVDALRLDLERSRRGETISARGEERLYVFSRFVRRHRASVSAGAGALMLLVGFVVTLAVQLHAVARERDRANREAIASKRVADFMIQMFRLSDTSEARGDNLNAREILEKASAEVDRGLAADPVLQARLRDVIGAVYMNLGLHSRARPLLEAALSQRRQVLGPEAPETLASMRAMGDLLAAEGKYPESEKMLRETVSLQRLSLGPEDPETALSIHYLAATLADEGQLVEAEELQREALDLQQRVLGPEHAATLKSMNGLGGILSKKGDYDGAVRLNRETLALEERVHGPDSPRTLHVLGNLAGNLANQGNYAEGEKITRLAIERKRRVMGPEHPSTLTSMQNLALILKRERRFPEAEAAGLEVLESRRRTLGQQHPDTVESMNVLALIRKDLRRLADVEKLQREALDLRRRTLGPRHPETAKLEYNLACTLALAGRRDEALAILRGALGHGLPASAAGSIEKDDDFKPLRDDARFDAIVAEAKKRSAR